MFRSVTFFILNILLQRESNSGNKKEKSLDIATKSNKSRENVHVFYVIYCYKYNKVTLSDVLDNELWSEEIIGNLYSTIGSKTVLIDN